MSQNKKIDIIDYITKYRKAQDLLKFPLTRIADKDEKQISQIPIGSNAAEAYYQLLKEKQKEKLQSTVCTMQQFSGMNNIAIGNEVLQESSSGMNNRVAVGHQPLGQQGFDRNPYTCAEINKQQCAKIRCPMCHWDEVNVGYEKQIRGETLRVARCRVCGHAWVIE